MQEASSYLNVLVQKGYWTHVQAKKFSQGYTSCMNAFDVLHRNTLPKSIAEDTPLSHTWVYPPEYTSRLFDDLNHVVDFDRLNELEQRYHYGDRLEQAITESSHAIAQLFPENAGVHIGFECVVTGLWITTFSRTINGEDFTFCLNIGTKNQAGQKSTEIAVLTYIPPTEILYGFQDLRSIPLVDEIIATHPRLNIHLPQGTEQIISQRRKAEKEYREKVKQLSFTHDIQPTTKVFTEGTAVPQMDKKVQKADEGPVGTNGVGPCVTVCTRGKTQESKLIIGLAHMDAKQDAQAILTELRTQFEKQGVSREAMEMYLIGGWRYEV